MSVVIGSVYKVELDETVPVGGEATSYTASADSGDVAVGGGFDLADGGGSVRILTSAPALDGSGNPNGWTVTLQNQDMASHTVKIFAVCMAVPPSR
jgi:hypothetical protein